MKKSLLLWGIFIALLIILSKTYGQMMSTPFTHTLVPSFKQTAPMQQKALNAPLPQPVVASDPEIQNAAPAPIISPPQMPLPLPSYDQNLFPQAPQGPVKLGPEPTAFATPVRKDSLAASQWQWSGSAVQKPAVTRDMTSAPEGKVPVKFYKALADLNFDRIKATFDANALESKDATGATPLAIVLREFEAEQVNPNEISQTQFNLIVDWLLSKNAQVNVSTKIGKTPLVYAAELGDTELIKKLLAKGANINGNHTDKKVAYTPLMAAAFNGHPEAIKVVLDNKASIDLRDDQGMTALMYAVKSDNPKILEEFLKIPSAELQKLVNMQDNSGMTALMYAVIANKKISIQELLKAGADKMLKNKLGKTVSDIAKDNKLTDLVGLF